MQRLGLLISAVLAVGSSFAMNEFGDLGTAKGKHPEFFRPGTVAKATLGGAEWYVYCGDAEKCFKEETDSELYEEAEVQAKMNFFNHFAKKDPGVKVDVKGAVKMYQCADDALRLVVMGVPVKNVVVTPGAKKNSTIPAKKVAAVVPASEKGNAGAQQPVKASEPVAVDLKNEQKKIVPISKDEPAKPIRPVAEAKETQVSDADKLSILRERLEKTPQDYHLRIRMARIFARQGNVKRALNNYSDAARLMDLDAMRSDADMVADLFEVAKYEDQNGDGAKALKHYRILLKMGNRDISRYANSRISDLLLSNRVSP